MFQRKKSRLFTSQWLKSCVALPLAFTSLAVLATGTLDNTFGNNGVTSYGIPFTGSTIMDVVMLPDDRMIVGGTGSTSQNVLAFARFNKNGNIDTSFGGGNGYVGYSSPMIDAALVEGFSVDSNYNIYVVAHGNALSDDAHIYKLNAAGAIDNNFSNTGVYLHSTHPRLPAGVDTTFKAVAVQPDNKVVVVGRSNSLTTGAFVLRLLPDGTPDSSFGVFGDGLVFFGQLPMASSSILSTNPESVKVSDSGAIVIGGFSNNAAWGSFAARFTANGLWDTSFNGTGVYLLQPPQSWGMDWAGFIELDRLGNAYLLSRVGTNLLNQCFVTKFMLNGQIDTSYGSGGHSLLTPPTGDFYNCGSIAAASHGGMAIAVMDRYPVAGATYNGPAKVLRLDHNGHLKTSFGNAGVATVWTPHITNSTYLAGLFNHTFVEAQSDGKLVFAIAEYQLDGPSYTIGRFNDVGNDFIPVPNTFGARGRQPQNTWVTSNLIQVQHLDATVAIAVEIDNGEYSINGLSYTSAPGWIRNNDLINVRNKTGSGSTFVATTTLTLGGDKDRKNAGMLRGKRTEVEFIISTGLIGIPMDPAPSERSLEIKGFTHVMP